MANLTERRDKSGRLISFSIRVHRGRGLDGKQLKPWTATFTVKQNWTEKSARKKAEAFAATFEKECRDGVTTDSRLRFSEYCNYCIDLKEQRGAKHSTVVRYRELTRRIYPAIGHVKLKELRADQLNSLYTSLSKITLNTGGDKAIVKVDLAAILKEKGLKQAHVAAQAKVGSSTVSDAIHGRQITTDKAKAICAALGVKMEKVFTVQKETRTLSPKTVIEYHRLIHTVLHQAEKEGLVPYNVAARAEPPKVTAKEVNYFQPEQVAAIRDALEEEPIKWRTLVHMFLITGARRGEILGLKWSKVDFTTNRVHICNSVLYAKDIGIYQDTPKTAKSDRFIVLPAETMRLLKSYKAWQAEERLRLGEYYENQDFVFCQDNGSPLHPDSVGDWLNKFSRRHSLPHINPHAFRHTMASMLYFNGVDSVSISKRLGHAQVSTTANIYAHVMEEADQKSADILANVFLKKA